MRKLALGQGVAGSRSPPLTKKLAKRAEKGSNRLFSLLQPHMDPEELYEAMQGVQPHSARHFSRNFLLMAREMLENFGSRYGESAQRSLAHILATAAQKQAFSENYDSWLRPIKTLAEEFGRKGLDLSGFLKFSFRKVVQECETHKELDASVKAAIEYSEKFGSPDAFCKDFLHTAISLHLPPEERTALIDEVMLRLQAMPPEKRQEHLRLAAGKLSQPTSEQEKKLREFLGELTRSQSGQ